MHMWGRKQKKTNPFCTYYIKDNYVTVFKFNKFFLVVLANFIYSYSFYLTLLTFSGKFPSTYKNE